MERPPTRSGSNMADTTPAVKEIATAAAGKSGKNYLTFHTNR